MQMKQMTVEDWVAEFHRNPKAFAQVALTERRLTSGASLATYERNMIKAVDMLKKAAE